MNNDELKTERQKDRTHTQKKLDFRSHIECLRMSGNVEKGMKIIAKIGKANTWTKTNTKKTMSETPENVRECQKMLENVGLHRVAKIVQRHKGPSPKSLDPDKN